MTSAHPFLDHLGLRIDREAGVVRLEVEARHRQANGVVHGSVLHALLDTVMGLHCVGVTGGAPVATAEISVRYLAPVFEGRLEGRARVRKAGKRVLVVEAEVARDDGEAVAVAQATFVPIRLE